MIFKIELLIGFCNGSVERVQSQKENKSSCSFHENLQSSLMLKKLKKPKGEQTVQKLTVTKIDKEGKSYVIVFLLWKDGENNLRY